MNDAGSGRPAGPDHAAEAAGGDDGEGRSRRPRRPPRRHLSEVLAELAADDSREAITVADLMQHLGGRARAALMFLFAAPNALPAPPGLSAVLGLPLVYLSFQMMLGRMPWLPRFIVSRGLPRATFAGMVERAHPLLARAERLLRPRWWIVVTPPAERALGAVCLLLAVVVTLPVPLGNMLPAFAISLIVLGMIERDGLWVSIGVLVAAAAAALSATVVYGMIKAGLFVLRGAFG